MSDTQEIKSRLDIVELISEHVSLRRSGSSYAGFCPFHPNTRTPAFYVFPETQTWHCFGACADGGDIFSFVMKKEGWDFKEALTRLAERAGVTLKQREPVDKAKRAREDKLIDLLTTAADYFHQLLLHAPQARFARQYIDERALNPETQAAFRIGYALDSWDACRTHFNSQGYDDEELLAVGLLTEKPETGSRYDRFRNRLIIPIRRIDGRIVGFGARTLDRDGIPKYLNSPQTSLFNKSHLLFGLDIAKPYIREARSVVIVEGYMDVMQAWQAGFRNVVAQMGTALTEEQLSLLKRYTKRFILALDADVAGLNATMRGLQVARETLDREVEVSFDARGLVRHEGRLKADIRVVSLPEGTDPDKIIRTDPDQWPRLMAQAKPVVAYVIELVTRDLDLGDAKAKAAVARQVLPLIKDIEDPIERDHYWQVLANALAVDERTLRQIRLPVKPSTQSSSAARKPGSSLPGLTTSRGDRTEDEAKGFILPSGSTASELRQRDYLRQCLQRPQAMIRVNEKLAEIEQAIVAEGDFDSAEDRALLRQMYQWIGDRTVVTIEELCDSLDAVLLDRVHSLLASPPTPETELDRLADTLVLSVLDWRLSRIKQLLSEVKQLYHEARNVNDVDSLEMCRQQLRELPLALLSINRARSAMSAVNRRRAEDAALGRI